jgi:hypothetical protein
MYYPGRPAQKPWRVARNYANFKADKMTSEVSDVWIRYCRAMNIKLKTGNDVVLRREQRKQQRRLNRYLCCPDSIEWDVN